MSRGNSGTHTGLRPVAWNSQFGWKMGIGRIGIGRRIGCGCLFALVVVSMVTLQEGYLRCYGAFARRIREPGLRAICLIGREP